jgi:hypothetical protein
MKPIISTEEKVAISLGAIPITNRKPIVSSMTGSQFKIALVIACVRKYGKGIKKILTVSG